MTNTTRAARLLALAAPFVFLNGCASSPYVRMAPPDGTSALGFKFGADRAAAKKVFRDAKVRVRDAPDERDALVADRCPFAPAAAPCRLVFGSQGLYAVQLDVPASDAGALRRAVEKGLGRPDRKKQAASEENTVLARWAPAGWTVTLSKGTPQVTPAVAALRVEYDSAVPPVVAGVPFGRMREDVEAALERQGAMVVQRAANATTYLGCPQGMTQALSCVILFRGERAAVVTQTINLAQPDDDRAALSAWETLAKQFEKDLGRSPQTQCPEDGPDPVAGDCTATWESERIVTVVGARRNRGAQHRGTISVYAAFTYPPLAPRGGEEEPLESQ